MDRKLQAELLSECARGRFKVASSLISQLDTFDECLAARVVIECCRVLCIKNIASTIAEEELYNLLTKCITSIHTLNDNLATGYLQSVYYIIKFFIQKRSFKLIIQMEDILIPKFIDLTNSTKITKLYVAVHSLIHNTVVDLLQSENIHESSQLLYHFCMLSLEMKANVCCVIQLVNIAYLYFKNASFINGDSKLQYDCYIKVVHLIKTYKKTEDINHKEIFRALMRLLQTVIKNLFRQNELDKIKQFIKIINTQTEELRETQFYSELCSILGCMSELIIDLRGTKQVAELLRNNFETCCKGLKHFSENYGVTEELQSICTIMFIMFFYLLESYINVQLKTWSICMTAQNQVVLYKLLAGIAEIISKTEFKCNTCSNCKVTKDLYTSICAVTLIGKLLKTSLDNDMFTYKSLAARAVPYFKKCCAFITILKSEECTKWKSAWSDTAVMIYNIAVKLYSEKYTECSDYFLLLIKSKLHLEGTTVSPSVFNFNVISTSLKCLSDVHLQAGEFRKALVFAAVQMLLSTETETKFQVWISVKNKNRRNDVVSDSILQKATVLCVLEQNKDEIKNFYPAINNKLENSVKQKLLLLELAQYKTLWPSRIPMMATFKKLFEVADTLTLVQVLIQTWGENLTSAHDEVLKMLSDIIIKLKFSIKYSNEDEIEMQIYLALLYIMYYYSETRKVRQKTVDEINRTVITEQLPTLPHEIPKNPNDECDLVSSYESLKLDEHLKIWKYLNEALEIFKVYIPRCTLPPLVDMLKEYNVFNNIVTIAQEALLHCHSFQSVQAWFIGLSLSKLLNNKLYILQSLSSLLEEPSINSEIIERLLTEADALISEMQMVNLSSEYWEVLTAYRISKSKVLLHRQEFQKGFEEYKHALNYFSNVTNNELLKIRLDFLHVQYLQLPCSLNIEGHNDLPLARFSGVFNDIINFVKISGFYTARSKAVLFEVNQFIAEVYKWMHLPREVRCYCRNIITFAQEAVVPLRTAYFLVYLAHADLLSVRLDDCRVKLNGLSDILCLDNKRTIFSQNEFQKEKVVVNKDEDMSELTADFAEIMLDCPTGDVCKQTLTGSPVLLTKPFKMPSFVTHVSECNCFYCTSVEYKQLVMEYIHLEAQLHVHYGNTTAAQACFNGALQLYKNINENQKAFRSKVAESLSCDPFCDIKDILCVTLGALLLNFGNNLLRMNDAKKAKYFNEQLVNLISQRKYKNPYLYDEALLQKLIMHLNLEEITTEAHQNPQAEIDFTTCDDNKEAPKTPENQQTKIIFPASYSPRPNSQPKRRLRKIKCDFSEKKGKNNNESNMFKANKLPFAIHISPDDEIANNAKLSKETENGENIESSTKFIYKTPAAKTATNKKVILQELPISSLTGINNNCPTEQDFSAVIPSSPNAYTSKAITASSVLQSRTELLTKKLKSTVKKNLANDDGEKNDIANNTNVKDKNKSKPLVCKNLISELTAAENHTVKTGKRNKTQNDNTTDISRIPVSTRVTRTRKNK